MLDVFARYSTAFQSGLKAAHHAVDSVRPTGRTERGKVNSPHGLSLVVLLR